MYIYAPHARKICKLYIQHILQNVFNSQRVQIIVHRVIDVLKFADYVHIFADLLIHFFMQVRLQLEALLAEKSRLAQENANLLRENQSLHQLVEYHQLTSQDLSASYEQVMQGMRLDFSSPLGKIESDSDYSENSYEEDGVIEQIS